MLQRAGFHQVIDVALDGVGFPHRRVVVVLAHHGAHAGACGVHGHLDVVLVARHEAARVGVHVHVDGALQQGVLRARAHLAHVGELLQEAEQPAAVGQLAQALVAVQAGPSPVLLTHRSPSMPSPARPCAGTRATMAPGASGETGW